MYMELEWVVAQLSMAADLSMPKGANPGKVCRALRTLGSLTEPTPSQTSPSAQDWLIREGILEANPKKSYHPEHTPLEELNEAWPPLKVKYPFPDTGLEEVLLNYAVIQQQVTPARLPDKTIVSAALKIEKNPIPEIYNEVMETRYYLPKEIEDLPETERASATLKLLQQIKSSNEFLKDLSPLPEQS